MFFVVGIGNRKTKVLGPVEKRVCPNCGREDWWELHRLRDFVTLFFVPVFPYKTQHLIVCPICNLAHEVAPESLERMREQAERNLALIQRP